MKYTLTIILFVLTTYTFSQEKEFKEGDAIEFFDGVNWLDGEIGKVNANGTYLIYVGGQKSKTKTLKKEDIQSLYMPEDKIITTTVTKSVYYESQKYTVLDVVKYLSGNEIIESEILNIGDDNTYQVYTDNSKTGVKWVKESDLTYVRNKNAVVNSDFKKGTLVSVFDGENWIDSEIIEAQNEMFQVFFNAEKTATKWVTSKELKLK